MWPFNVVGRLRGECFSLFECCFETKIKIKKDSVRLLYIIWVYSVWISAKLNLSYHVKFYGVQIFLPYIVIFFLDLQTTIMLVSICFFSK